VHELVPILEVDAEEERGPGIHGDDCSRRALRCLGGTTTV
jgi:hypothetical protein